MAKRPSYISRAYPTTDVWSLVEDAFSEIEELGNECQEAANNFPNPSHPKAEAFSDVAQELQGVSQPDEIDIPEDGPISTLSPIPQITDLQIQVPSDRRRQTSRAIRLANAVSKLQAALDTLTTYRDDVVVPARDTAFEAMETRQAECDDLPNTAYERDELYEQHEAKHKTLENFASALNDYIDSLQATIDAVDGLEFPGMFG